MDLLKILATAIEAINILVDNDYPLKANQIGFVLLKSLNALKLKHPDSIKEIKGMGALYGVSFYSPLDILLIFSKIFLLHSYKIKKNSLKK